MDEAADKKMARKLIRIAGRVLKYLALGLLALELLSFAAISVINYAIYGNIHEGGRVRYDPYALFLSRSGVRPTVHPTPPTIHSRKVWIFGGSTMRGNTKDDAKTIPSFLARNLRAEPNALDCGVENFGENSFNSLLEVKYLQKIQIERGHIPDILLFYDGANDAGYLAQYRTVLGHHGYRRMSGLIQSYRDSPVGVFKGLNAAWRASFTRELFDKIRQTLVTLDANSILLADFLDTLERRYDYLDRTATSNGGTFVLFWQPVLWVETGNPPPAVRDAEQSGAPKGGRLMKIEHNYLTIYEAVRGRLADKPYFVDLHDVLYDRQETAYQPDGVHLTDYGRECVAGVMTKHLKARFGGKQLSIHTETAR